MRKILFIRIRILILVASFILLFVQTRSMFPSLFPIVQNTPIRLVDYGGSAPGCIGEVIGHEGEVIIFRMYAEDDDRFYYITYSRFLKK